MLTTDGVEELRRSEIGRELMRGSGERELLLVMVLCGSERDGGGGFARERENWLWWRPRVQFET